MRQASDEVETSIDHLKGMHSDFQQLFSMKYVSVRIGKLPVEEKARSAISGLVTRLGISSMIFSTLYGSFFGYEELLDPVFENIGLDFLPLKVFKQTNFILITAVAIGVALRRDGHFTPTIIHTVQCNS